jgi:hypothetical protein
MFRMGLRRRRQAGCAVPADAKVRPARDVLVAERDGVAVLLDLRHEVYLGLDEVGTVAWREIENGASAESVARRVCQEYDAPADAVREDMQRFIGDLRGRRLVVSA